MKKKILGVVCLLGCWIFLGNSSVSAWGEEDQLKDDNLRLEISIKIITNEINSLKKFYGTNVQESFDLYHVRLQQIQEEQRQCLEQIVHCMGTRGEELKQKLEDKISYQAPSFFLYRRTFPLNYEGPAKAKNQLLFQNRGEEFYEAYIGVYADRKSVERFYFPGRVADLEVYRVWVDSNREYSFTTPEPNSTSKKYFPDSPFFEVIRQAHEMKLTLCRNQKILKEALAEQKQLQEQITAEFAQEKSVFDAQVTAKSAELAREKERHRTGSCSGRRFLAGRRGNAATLGCRRGGGSAI